MNTLPLFSGPVSISGHALAGDRIVRFIYLDEAGRSSNEPVCVCVGAIIKAEEQWRDLAQHHHSIVQTYIPEEDRDGFIFHATELFSGGSYFTREKWSRETRMEILCKLLSAQKLFHLPLSIGYSFKSERQRKILPNPDRSKKGYAQFRHVAAFVCCLCGCERYLRDLGMNDELALVVAEDVPDIRKRLKETFKRLKDGRLGPDFWEGMLPFRHIADTPLFAEKPDAPLLQFVDAFAFSVRRWLGNLEGGNELMRAMMGPEFEHINLGPWGETGVKVYTGLRKHERAKLAEDGKGEEWETILKYRRPA